MKATNHPSDKMTIKNNNGDLLLEIDAEGVKSIKFKDGNEITGEDISSAIDKADTLPAVTEADAGKALVVDEEGNIVAAGDKPVITLALTDISSIMTSLVTQYATTTDKISYGVYTLTASEAAAVKAKFDPILLRPNKDCFLMVEGFRTKFDAYIYSWAGGVVVATNILRLVKTDSPAFDNMISYYINIQDNGDVYIETSSQKINRIA